MGTGVGCGLDFACPRKWARAPRTTPPTLPSAPLPLLEDLALLGDDAGLALDIACGMTPVPTRAGLRWRLTGDLGVNYIASLVRTGGGE